MESHHGGDWHGLRKKTQSEFVDDVVQVLPNTHVGGSYGCVDRSVDRLHCHHGSEARPYFLIVLKTIMPGMPVK